MSKKTATYSGETASVTWDGPLCIHAGECGRAKNALFVSGRDPWCNPDEVPVEVVDDVVARCPTGALWYDVADGGAGQQVDSSENHVVVSNDGPIFLSGDLQIQGAPDRLKGLAFRAALCRCGASQNKPFCDNAHREAGFRDHGAVGESGSEDEGGEGTLSVRALQDGPLLLNGPHTIVTGAGRAAWRGSKSALCRCGQSKNKPFCDGAHKGAGFSAPEGTSLD